MATNSLGHTLFSLQGRVGRGVFWGWFLFLSIAHAVFISWAYTNTSSYGYDYRNVLDKGTSLILDFLLFWPSFAITVKRWHDVNKSGFWILINLIPVFGWMYAFIYNGFVRGDSSSNRFGPATS